MIRSRLHVDRRRTRLGRWFPLCLYLLNYILWLRKGIVADTPNVLWLAALPLAAPLLYIVRTKRLGR